MVVVCKHAAASLAGWLPLDFLVLLSQLLSADLVLVLVAVFSTCLLTLLLAVLPPLANKWLATSELSWLTIVLVWLLSQLPMCRLVLVWCTCWLTLLLIWWLPQLDCSASADLLTLSLILLLRSVNLLAMPLLLCWLTMVLGWVVGLMLWSAARPWCGWASSAVVPRL